MVASDAVFAKIETRLGKIDPAKQKIKSNYKFIITNGGAVVKTWVLDLQAIKLAVGDGPADCTFKVSDEVMCDIGSGKITIVNAIKEGKVSVEGDKSLAELLQPFVAEL